MAANGTRIRWGLWIPVAACAAGAALGGWYVFPRANGGGEPAPVRAEGGKSAAPVAVEVVSPRPGGIRRDSVQPGTVEPFASADLYAKVSGYLASQELERGGKVVERDGAAVVVDIGTRVEKGDVLARIAVPEHVRQVERDQARVRNAAAKVKQMDAHLRAAQAEARASEASVVLARVMVKAKAAYRHYRQKQLDRIKALAAERAVDMKLVDEQEDYFLSAQEAENAANEQVNSAIEHAAATRAKIAQAEADVDEAKANVGVAEAELARSQVMLDYAAIKAPYSGVVTKRNFHPGDFIKSADQGGSVPLLAVERTDLMRVVVRVPDRDVPYVTLGDPAVIEIDALPGVVFESKPGSPVGVARWSDAEDPQSRTMRTEVDVPNPDDKLRHGMYGRVTLILSEGTPNAVRVPAGALSGKAEGGRGTVRVVRDGRAHLVPVRYATDNGLEVEVVTGLTPADRVIVRAAGPLEEGAPVTVGAEAAGASSAGH